MSLNLLFHIWEREARWGWWPMLARVVADLRLECRTWWLSSSPLQLATSPQIHSSRMIYSCAFLCGSLTVTFEGEEWHLTCVACEVVNRALSTSHIEVNTCSCIKRSLFPLPPHPAKPFLTLKKRSSDPGSCFKSWSDSSRFLTFKHPLVLQNHHLHHLTCTQQLTVYKCIHPLYPLIPIIFHWNFAILRKQAGRGEVTGPRSHS